jgi:hypothetical protein
LLGARLRADENAVSDRTTVGDLRPRLDETELDLPPGWHLVRVGPQDQSVAIGPGGAYALIIRADDGAPVTLYDRALFVRNRRTNALLSATARADGATRALQELLGEPISCDPVVVVAGDELTVRSRPDDVHVLHDHLLNRWLSHLPRTFDDARVQHIVHLAS